MDNEGLPEHLQRRALIVSGASWYDILTKDEKSRMDAYDMTILEMIRKRLKNRKDVRKAIKVPNTIDMDLIQRDVHLEMGGLTDEEFQAKFKKLEDMALLRRYVTLNI